MTAIELKYYPDDRPGITRRKRGRGYSYMAPDGTAIDAPSERKRLDALAVPPAYADVWMSPLPHGHLQATGRDARKRKQYRYHEVWSQLQAENKYAALPDFGAALPRIRRKLRRDLSEDVGEQTFALACAVKLMDRLALRIGNPTYTEENGSFGTLTLQERHLRLKDDGIHLRYTAKGGKKVQKRIADRTLIRSLNTIADVPGAELLTWVDDEGEPRALTSQAVNAYLMEASGLEDITSKTFRTWAGTLAAFEAVENGAATIKEMAQEAAKRLHNTATVARNSYIHPAVIDLATSPMPKLKPREISDLRKSEQRLLSLLER